MTYNGSSNYETWNVGLWLDNTQEPYWHFSDRAAELVDLDGDAAELAKEIEQWVDARPGFSDLDASEMSQVDWPEIASAFIETAKEG